jgi:hypothetical protein
MQTAAVVWSLHRPETSLYMSAIYEFRVRPTSLRLTRSTAPYSLVTSATAVTVLVNEPLRRTLQLLFILTQQTFIFRTRFRLQILLSWWTFMFRRIQFSEFSRVQLTNVIRFVGCRPYSPRVDKILAPFSTIKQNDAIIVHRAAHDNGPDLLNAAVL